MSTIRATYVQHGSSSVPNITLNASGQVVVASGIVSSGTFAAPSGSAAAPGVYFDGDTDTGLYSPGANEVALTASGTEQLLITSDRYVRLASGTGGIQFGGDTAATNALDDYEEGTWTPTVTQGFTSPTYAAGNSGIYTKVGNIVRVHGRLSLTGGTATASQIRIASLPFVCKNTASQYVTCTYYLNGGTGTIGNALKPLVQPGQSYIAIWSQGNTNVSSVNGTTLSNAMDIVFQAVYEV